MKFLKNILLLSSLILFSSCYAFFEEKIPMSFDNVSTGLDTFVQASSKVTKLDTPSQVFVSSHQYSDRIKLSWSKVDNATSYYIERAVIDTTKSAEETEVTEDKFEVLKNYCSKTEYEDVILNEPSSSSSEYNNIYYYRIQARNVSSGLESDFTTVFDQKDSDGNLIAPVLYSGRLLSSPQNVEASKGSDESYIYLTWSSVPGASDYVIYRTEKENGTNAEEIKSVKSNELSYKDLMLESERGTEFYYKVVAKNNDNSSAESSLAMGYSLQYGAPTAPTGIKVVNPYAESKKSLTLTWNALSDAATGTTRSVSIYRNSSADSVYTLVKSGLENVTEYTDSSNLKPSVTYYYYIQTVDIDENNEKIKSAFSEKSDDASGYLLSPPENVSVLTGSSSSKKILKFKPALGHLEQNLDFTYRIYYLDSKDGTPNVLTECTTFDYDDEKYISIEVENKPYYKITTLYSGCADSESDYSEVVAPVPESPKNVSATKTKNLSSEMGESWVCNSNNVYPVKISWSAPTEGNAPYGYNVYRSTKIDSSFKKITDEPVTTLYYYDANDSAKAGQFYFYKVTSVNDLKQGKNSNNPSNDMPENGGNRESWGYGAITRDQWFREYNKEVATSQSKLTLMHKPNDLDKVGSESIKAYLPVNGSIGSLSYKAAVAGLGAEITMPYTNYSDHTILGTSSSGQFVIGLNYVLNGNTDTTSNMSANGNMHGTVNCYHYEDYTYSGELNDKVNNKTWVCTNVKLFQGMYPGKAVYDNLQIKGGAAGGGYYSVTTYELDRTSDSNGTVIFDEGQVDWKVGEESK